MIVKVDGLSEGVKRPARKFLFAAGGVSRRESADSRRKDRRGVRCVVAAK